MINISRYGQDSLLINFEQKIDPEIHHKVRAYYLQLKEWQEVHYQIPAYCSLTVVYDTSITSFEDIKGKIESIKLESTQSTEDQKIIEIPVCYDESLGPDLEMMSEKLGISRDEIISLHTSTDYNVFMMGFLPGFGYLGQVPDSIAFARKENPRKRVAAGSVGIAGRQTGIYPSSAPGGWQIIGNTPVKIFDWSKEDAFLLSVGAKVRFKAIDMDTYNKLTKDAE